MICNNLSVSENGHLLFANQDTSKLAKQYETPLYLLDEDRIRANCKMYLKAFTDNFGKESLPVYASKACAIPAIYKIISSEGLGTDLVSSGEIFTAYESGFDMSKSFFHGNVKTDADIAFAMDCNTGYFVVDNREELLAVSKEAGKRGIIQKILLRLTPGIDPHTYEAISTGKVDSKFGFPIETGAAEEILTQALKLKNIEISGYHCHVGSMVFYEDVYERTADVMLGFSAQMKEKLEYYPEILDLGGGYGVRYTDDDPIVNIPAKIAALAVHIKNKCSELNIPLPRIIMEPGRSIVADAGLTLYTVGSIKTIPGYKNYVAIDGGMTDNPRYALYEAKYTCLAAEKMNEETSFICDLVGRCCESGDIIQPKIKLPESIKRGDIIAVCTTGAYNYSMASNYNRIPKPPVIMLSQGKSRVAVKRETYKDLIKCEIF